MQTLKEGKAFSDVAMEFSDDGTAQNGGLLGYMDKTSSLVPEFIEGAYKYQEG
ncbi:peptidyl-prolyl cis-trans isomerase [Erysipelothrix sp. Poltava]|nr:peptidyl-prolyl cis-trans isomerase [Erysipelothrix sp. Poltava]